MVDPSTRLNLAVVGCGYAAGEYYLPEMHRLPDGARLVAVCDRDPDRAAAARERFGVDRAYSDLDALLADDGVDLVVNLTPHQHHFAVSRAALAAGRHVYSEKPLALSVADADELVGAADAAGRTLSCAPATLVMPTARHWRQLIDAGTIGRPTFARVQILTDGGVDEDFLPEHAWYFSRGNGPLIDMGVYAVTALTGLFGPVRQVSAMAKHLVKEYAPPAVGHPPVPNETADSVHLHLDLGPLVASIDVNTCVQDSRNERYEVYGDRGTLSGDLVSANEPVHVFEAGSGWRVEQPPELPRPDDWFQGLAHTVDQLLTGGELVTSAGHARHVLDVIRTAEAAAYEGRTLPVPSRWTPAGPRAAG
jgi:predicted dehydrogenase